jgi:prepilin-type processing-associated H-X9-DG protein
VNWWLCEAAQAVCGSPPQPVFKNAFCTENNLDHPCTTPVVADGGLSRAIPLPTDSPSDDLFKTKPLISNMAVMTLPRHGSRPQALPAHWPLDQPLPGAVNVAFFDGHCEPVKLDRLWQLYWHLNYQAKAKRPGLP